MAGFGRTRGKASGIVRYRQTREFPDPFQGQGGGLKRSAEAAEKLEEAMLWVQQSDHYNKIDLWLKENKQRTVRQTISAEKVAVMKEHRKYITGVEPVAMCNTFTVDEVKLTTSGERFGIDGKPLPSGNEIGWKWACRPIVEPVINDAIEALGLPVAVKFVETTKGSPAIAVSEAVIEKSDITSCYDQIAIAATATTNAVN